MDQEAYNKIKAYIARKLIPALHDELDDATQYVAMRVFENPSASWEYCFYDWLRENGYGDRGKVAAKTMSISTRVGLGTNDEGDCESLLDIGSESEEPNFSNKIDAERMIGFLKGRRREIALMRFVDDMSEQEIANRHQVTESRISQLLSEAINKMRKLSSIHDSEDYRLMLGFTGLMKNQESMSDVRRIYFDYLIG